MPEMFFTYVLTLNHSVGAGEMAQQLTVLATKPACPSLIPRT